MMYEPVLQLNVTCSKLACHLQRRVSISLSEISYTVYIRSLDSLELQYTFSCKCILCRIPETLPLTIPRRPNSASAFKMDSTREIPLI